MLTMKHPSRHLVLSLFTLALVACAAAAPKQKIGSNEQIVAEGPPGPSASASPLPPDEPPPPPPPPPPPDKETDAGKGGPRNPITERKDDTDSDDLWGDVIQQQKTTAADPLKSRGSAMGGEGSTGAPGGTGIASNPQKTARKGGSPAPIDPTSQSIGAASEIRGSLEKAEIQRVVRAHLNEVKRCYDQALQRQPNLEGKVVVKMTIGKTGSVQTATTQESTLSDRPTEQCILGVVLKWSFPKPTGEGSVVVSYPFTFQTAD